MQLIVGAIEWVYKSSIQAIKGAAERVAEVYKQVLGIKGVGE